MSVQDTLTLLDLLTILHTLLSSLMVKGPLQSLGTGETLVDFNV